MIGNGMVMGVGFGMIILAVPFATSLNRFVPSVASFSPNTRKNNRNSNSLQSVSLSYHEQYTYGCAYRPAIATEYILHRNNGRHAFKT